MGALVAPIHLVIVRVLLDVYLGIMLIMGPQGGHAERWLPVCVGGFSATVR